jgi:hypothetical protein
MSSYTVQLIALRCIQAQELDGDETYLNLNGVTVWQAGRFHMHHHPTRENQVSEFDFAGGRRHNQHGWEPLAPYNPKDYLFAKLTGESHFELWEDDFLKPDDWLGTTPISARDAGHGPISIAFVRAGAHYLLTYQVTNAE